MNELKAHNINDLSLNDIVNCDFYLKSEVDDVISEKELEFANLRNDALNTDKAREKWMQLARKQAIELRYQKYKRCLSNAKGCLYLFWYYTEASFRESANRMWKWHERWLELAEKFKDKVAK